MLVACFSAICGSNEPSVSRGTYNAICPSPLRTVFWLVPLRTFEPARATLA